MLQACVHFLFFDELASISLGYTLAYSGAKTGVVFDLPQRRFFHPMLGICARGGSNLCKLHFLLSREMHFHGLESTEKFCLQQGVNDPTEVRKSGLWEAISVMICENDEIWLTAFAWV